MSLLLLFNLGGPVEPTPEPVSEITDRPFFAWNNLADTATFSGGSWFPTMPLANLKTRKQARAARSTSADPAASQFIVDLGSTKIWRLVSLVAHNISLDGRWRVTAGSDALVASPTYDSGWMKAWPRVYQTEDLEWEDDNFWTGQYSAAEIAGLNPTVAHRPAQYRSERYLKIEIEDPGNQASVIQIGRAFIANGWSPSSKIAVGASFGIVDETEVQKTYSGSEVFDVKRRRREANIELGLLEEQESYGKALEMMRQAGVSGEVFFIWRGSDTTRALQRQFLSRMQRLNPIQHPYPSHQSVAFNFLEL